MEQQKEIENEVRFGPNAYCRKGLGFCHPANYMYTKHADFETEKHCGGKSQLSKEKAQGFCCDLVCHLHFLNFHSSAL